MIESDNLFDATLEVEKLLRTRTHRIHTEKWQGFDIKDRPEAGMHEITDLFIKADLGGIEDINQYAKILLPNLPWADEHFYERIGGLPLNPGETWKNWPWALKADHSRIFGGKFSHTYMERYWPRYTGTAVNLGVTSDMQGHRFRYGDLEDVIQLLVREPLTRQAYLPIFFPEDTGAVHGNRVPCTLGYHWIVRDGKINTFYPIRSCDYYRHFRDDIYLTIRLTLWLLERLREVGGDYWRSVGIGSYSMWIGSLHMFRNDYIKLFGSDHETSHKR